jgi:hypothetical protein
VFVHLIGADYGGVVDAKAKKEKIVKATKKGAAVLDQYIPDHTKQNYHVLQVVRGFTSYSLLLVGSLLQFYHT